MKRQSGLWLVVGSLVVFALASCGGSGGSCGKVQPCGGSPVGNWTIASYCVNSAGSSQSSGCPGATVGVSGLKESGTFTFNADMTYSENVMLSGALQINYPQSCLTSGTVTLTCAGLNTQLQALVGATSLYQSASCTGSGSCTCTLAVNPQTAAAQGTYTTAGTTLTLNATTGTGDGGDYCVQGNSLHLLTLDMSMSMGTMGTATIQSDIVLTK